MKTLPTLNEIQADLDATDRDIERLQVICDAIGEFISDSHGEDRRILQVDHFRWRAILGQALELKTAIERAYAKVKAQEQSK